MTKSVRILRTLFQVSDRVVAHRGVFPFLVLGFAALYASAAPPAPPTPPPTVQSLAKDLATLTTQVNVLAATVSALQTNLSTLQTNIGTLQSQVAKLDGQIVASDLVGAYTMSGLQVELAGSLTCAQNLFTCGTQVASYVYAGTLTLNADYTASLSATEEGTRLFPSGNNVTLDNQNMSLTPLTWAYSGGVVTITGIAQVTVAAGGHLLITVGANHGSCPSTSGPCDNTDVILIFTRLQ